MTNDKTNKQHPGLYLKTNEGKRLRAGHLWIFSNEVDVTKSPLNQFEPGQSVNVYDSKNKSLGSAYINPHSLICARIFSRKPNVELNYTFLTGRINTALALRKHHFEAPYYRMVYGESDGLPGLVVDRFDDVLVAQITTAGMEQHKTRIVEVLSELLNPSVIIFRNDSSIRKLEGLDCYSETVLGTEPEKLQIIENGAHFETPALSGQKTGWFYDHRQNRLRLRDHAKGRRVLDVFSYIGGWGIQAALGGATDVTCIDSSKAALDQLQLNAELNNVADKVATLQGDAFDALTQLRGEGEHYDVIVVDPPAFIKRKKDKKSGLTAYQRINQLAMRLLNKDGILVSCSCSYHLSANELLNIVLQAARHTDRDIQIVEQGHQGLDHPFHPGILETNYLKAYFARITPTR